MTGPRTPATGANRAAGVDLAGQDPVDIVRFPKSARDWQSDRYLNSSSLLEARSLEISYD